MIFFLACFLRFCILIPNPSLDGKLFYRRMYRSLASSFALSKRGVILMGREVLQTVKVECFEGHWREINIKKKRHKKGGHFFAEGF